MDLFVQLELSLSMMLITYLLPFSLLLNLLKFLLVLDDADLMTILHLNGLSIVFKFKRLALPPLLRALLFKRAHIGTRILTRFLRQLNLWTLCFYSHISSQLLLLLLYQCNITTHLRPILEGQSS